MASENNALVEVFIAANGRSPTEMELDEVVRFLENFANEDNSKCINIQDNRSNGNSKSGDATVLAEKVGNLVVAEKFVGVPKELTLNRRNTCCILANYFKNSEQTPLDWYEIDERTIDETFSWLNFEVQKKHDLSANKIKGWIKEICKEDYGNQDCFALFLLSHGNAKREILGADSKPIDIEVDILENLTNVTSLQGKPKLIFIQACRGAKEMKMFQTQSDIQAAGSNVDAETVPKAEKADTFVYYSTTQGNKAWVGSYQGSFFINKLCTVLQQYCQEYHFDDVVTKVNDILSRHVCKTGENKNVVQVSEACHTLTSKIRFNPLGEFCEFRKNFQYKEY